MRVEGVIDPAFCKPVVTTETGAEIGQTVGTLGGGIGGVVPVVAVDNDFGTSINRRGLTELPRVLGTGIGGKFRSINQMITTDVDGAIRTEWIGVNGSRTTEKARIGVTNAAKNIPASYRTQVEFEFDTFAIGAAGISDVVLRSGRQV